MPTIARDRKDRLTDRGGRHLIKGGFRVAPVNATGAGGYAAGAFTW